MSGTMAKKRPGSRHKDRHNVSLPGALYDLIQDLANKERRPLRLQVIIAVEEHLRSKGIEIPDPRNPSPRPAE